MAKDIDIAVALAELITAHSFSEEITCEFRFDQYVENERVDDIQLRVSAETDTRHREGRGTWVRACVISLVIIAPQQSNSSATVDANEEITSLLDLWDEVLDFVQVQKPAGRPAVELRAFDNTRFDKDKLHSDRQFRAGVAITYKLT